MVPVIVFAIVQGLDEFRDCIPKFIACFTKLKQFLFVDMVESLTIHMRDYHIEEIRLQYIQDTEFECVKRTCDEGFQDIRQQIVQSVIKCEKNKIIDQSVNRNFESNSNILSDTQCNDFEIKNIKVNANDNAKEDKNLEFKINKKWNIEDKYETQDLSNCDVPNLKGKSPINYEKSKDCIDFENSSNKSVSCNRCENLIAIGRSGPCWTCTNKKTKKCIFEKIKNSNSKTISLNEVFNQNTSNTFDSKFLLKERIIEAKQFVHHSDSRRGVHSSQLKTFNNLFGIPKENILLNSSHPMFIKKYTSNTNTSIEGLDNIKTVENVPLLDIASTSSNVSFLNLGIYIEIL